MRELVSTLRKNNIRLKLVEGELSVKYPKGKIDRDLLEEIRLNKPRLIDYLTTIQQYDYLDIPLARDHASYVLSSAQNRLWILSQFAERSIAYNMNAVQMFEGKLDRLALTHAFNILIQRHEILRTTFNTDEQ